MRVLVVDDEYQKTEEISKLLDGIEGLELQHVTTAHAARVSLRQSAFDLLIIDINLPDVVGAAPTAEGGLALFDILLLDEFVVLPPDVLFLTGRQELVAEVNAKCLDRGAMLCQYRADSEQWKLSILGRVKYVGRRHARTSSPAPVDVAIVTALRKPELDAVLQLPYGWSSRRLAGDPVSYHLGQIQLDDGAISVVAACAQRKGMPSAAALSSRLSSVFRPKYLIMLGICAGVRGKTSLGDVIVADPTWDWGSGKRTQDDEGSPVFLAAPHQRPLNTHVSQLAVEMANDASVGQSIRAGWMGSVPAGMLSVRVGPMASGASVIADDHSIDSILSQQRELLAVEMEAYAVMAAAEYANEPVPVAVVIKSVCDFADIEKGDSWQEYASYTSAAFADRLLRNRGLMFRR
jgi:nucleoside phosphorylase